MKLLRVRRHGRWRNVEIATLEDFQAVARTPNTSIDEAVFAALDGSHCRFLHDALLDLFEHGNSDLRWNVSVAMNSLDRRLRPARLRFRRKSRFASPMLRWLETHRDHNLRKDVAQFFPDDWDRRAARPVMGVVSNPNESVELRAQAAAWIAELTRFEDQRNRLNKRMIQTAIEGTRDPAPEIRFWCLFALGNSGSRRALKACRALLSDQTICPGWWKISEEASDAVARILGQPTPDRDCVPNVCDSDTKDRNNES